MWSGSKALGIGAPAQQYQSKQGLRRYGAIAEGWKARPMRTERKRSSSGNARKKIKKIRRISQIFLAFVEKCGIIKL